MWTEAPGYVENEVTRRKNYGPELDVLPKLETQSCGFIRGTIIKMNTKYCGAYLMVALNPMIVFKFRSNSNIK